MQGHLSFGLLNTALISFNWLNKLLVTKVDDFN